MRSERESALELAGNQCHRLSRPTLMLLSGQKAELYGPLEQPG